MVKLQSLMFTITFVLLVIGVNDSRSDGFAKADFGASAIAAIIAAVVAATATGISSGVSSQEADQAKEEQKRLFDAQTQVGKENNAFLMHQTALQNEQAEDRFAYEKENRNYNVLLNKAKQVESLLNTNTSLRDSVLSKWGV